MQRSVVAACLAACTLAKIYLPTKEWDIRKWRLLPLMPYIFLENECKYVIFLTDDDNYVITVRCKFDDN